jgi:post-segregation antitoxin (ccd killing protein)
MGRNKKIEEEKKTKVSVALDRELLEYYRNLHINVSSLVNKLLKDYRENGHKGLY